MKQKQQKHVLLLLLVLMLCAAMAFTGCSTNSLTTPKQDEVVDIFLGQGQTSFLFTVTNAENQSITYKIHTDKTTVGDALLEHGLIEGEDGPYGLYVKTVAGITLDFDADGRYWAFYINGEYAMSGVDQTEIEAGDSYAFKAEK